MVARQGSVPPSNERYGAAEVVEMNQGQREEWLDELRFEAWLEAFFDGATDEEVDANRSVVMHDG